MSIRTRLLLIALVATLLPALLIAGRFVQDRTTAIAAASYELPVIANRLAAGLEEKIQGTEQLHFGLARARDLDTRDRGACSEFLSQVREKYPQYTGILSIDPDGKLFCDSLNSGRDLDLTDRAYFRQALTAHDAITLQSAFGRLTGIAVLQIAYPVRSPTGALRFVLLASLNLARFTQAYAKDLQLPGAAVLIVDDAGQVLAHAGEGGAELEPGASLADTALFDFARAAAGGSVSEIEGRDGKTRVWAVAQSPLLRNAGMHVVVGHSRGTLVAAADRRFAQDLMLLAAAALVVFLSVWFLAEMGIRRHITTIANMVTRLGRDELGVRIAPPHPRGEFGALMAVLNQSAQAQEAQHVAVADLDERLRQSQRLEAVGQLTGGVAHDFNNLLTVILGSGEALKEQLDGDSRMGALAQMIVTAAQRGADLTARLLAFARKQPLDPKAVDVNALVAGMDPLLRRTLGEHIEIEFTRGGGVWLALVDPGQLESALLNLCLNARDAMPSGGRLSIETANTHLDQDYADLHAEVRPGQYVLLVVSDNGMGMAPGDLQRAFEPFFTTKQKGKGTGLGLAMVYGFIKQSGGHVNIYSEPGQGTAVRMYLPRALDTPTTQDVTRPTLEVAGGQETILLVEDDELVRGFATGQLTALGYHVVAVSNGPQALEVLRSDTPIDLLFTDVVMPGMSGRELVDEAARLRPGLKVLYTSGYTENAIVHHGRLDPGVRLLTKPYRRSDLARRMREALAPD